MDEYIDSETARLGPASCDADRTRTALIAAALARLARVGYTATTVH